MAMFTYHLIEADGGTRSFELRECASEVEAQDAFPELFRQYSSATAIELWDDLGKLSLTGRPMGNGLPPRALIRRL